MSSSWSWPLTAAVARLLLLRTLELVSEQDRPLVETQSSAARAVWLWLSDTRLRRFNGRDNASRSLGSAFACFVAKFLSGTVAVVDVSGTRPRTEYSSAFVCDDGAIFVQCVANPRQLRDDGTLFGLIQLRWPDAAPVRGIQIRAPEGEQQYCSGVAMAPDGCVVTVQSMLCKMTLWSQSGAVRTFKLPHPFKVCASNAAIAVMHHRHVSEPFTRFTAILSLFRRDGTPCWSTPHPFDDHSQMCFDSDGGRVLASDSSVSQVRAYSSATGELMFVTMQLLRHISSLAVSSNNEIIVCCNGAVAIVPFAEARPMWLFAHHSGIKGCFVIRNTLLIHRAAHDPYGFLDGIAGLKFC